MGYWEPRHPGCQEEALTPVEQTKLAKRAYSISCSIVDGLPSAPNETRHPLLKSTGGGADGAD